MNKIKKLFALSTVLLVPATAFAQSNVQVQTILGFIMRILATVVPIVIALGVVYFIYALIQYLMAKDEESRGESKSHMITGLIVLFVIASLWGLIGFIGTFVGVSQGGSVPLPCIDTNPILAGCQP